MKELIILRGLPGSGKSTLADDLAKEPDYNTVICSTDFFWGAPYNFNSKLLGVAHQWNQSMVALYMYRGHQRIVVDNTNTTFKEMQPYLELAALLGYTVCIMEPKTAWAKNPTECAKRNSHGVSLAKISEMLNRWEDIKINCVDKGE